MHPDEHDEDQASPLVVSHMWQWGRTLPNVE